MTNPDFYAKADQLADQARADGRLAAATAVEQAMLGGATSSEILSRLHAACVDISVEYKGDQALSTRAALLADELRSFLERNGWQTLP